nr:hypothetical protein [Tanacetum cinerariifolium]
MTSFGYRSNPRYAIKECSSCGTLYTRDCVCSMGTVEDKIHVPKPPKNRARCTRCGYLVNGPNCQGCALLRQELEENLVAHSPDFQNTSEPSNASTNVVNAPREPNVAKQDNGNFVDKIIFRAPDSPDQFYCFHCKDVLRAGEALFLKLLHKVLRISTIVAMSVEDLVTHSQDFQNTSESSDDSTNVVNAPREPFVIKQDYGSFVDKIICDLNRAPDTPHLHTISPNQFHCFHCKDVLGDGEACQRCTCTRCKSGLSKGLCYICGNNYNSLNDSPTISENSSQSPPHINHHCCYEYGDPLDGIFYKRCTCKSCGKDAHIGYNCPPKVSVISNPEPCKNQTIDELPQTLLSFHLTFHSGYESPFTCDSTPNYVDESPNVFNPPPQPPVYSCEFCGNDAHYGHYCTPQAPFIYPKPCYNQDFNFLQDFHNFPQQYPCCDDAGLLMKLTNIKEEQAAKAQNWKLLVCFDDDDDEERSNSLKDNIISGLPPCSAITPNEPVLSTEEPDNSLCMRDEHLDTILAMESDEVIKSSVENLIPIPIESEGIPEHMCDVPFHDHSPPHDVSKDQIEDFSKPNDEFSSIDDDSFSIDNINYVEASPPDSKLVSSEVMEIVIPECYCSL